MKLEMELIEKVERMGDYWGRRVAVEGLLRSRLVKIYCKE